MAHSQAQRAFGGGGDTGASGVTGEPLTAWLPCSSGGGGRGGALGGDVYSQLWQSITRADGSLPRPPARSGNSGAGSSWTAGGEVGSSYCGSNLVAAALHLDDDVAEAELPPPPPPPPDDPGVGAGAGASTSSGWNSNALLKRSRDEFDSRGEVVLLILCRCQCVSEFRLRKFSSIGERDKKNICRTPTWTPSTRRRRRGGRRPSAGRAPPRSTTCRSG